MFLEVIHMRFFWRCEENMSENRFVFRNSVKTREVLFAIQVLFQRCRYVNCYVYFCFLDYTKAFDRYQHEQMISVLNEDGVDTKDMHIISNLYLGEKAAMRVDNEFYRDKSRSAPEVHVIASFI